MHCKESENYDFLRAGLRGCGTGDSSPFIPFNRPLEQWGKQQKVG